MAIVSSIIIEDFIQIDGRTWIAEQHTDQLGVVYIFRYKAAEGADVNAIMLARVASINASLIANEIAGNIAAVITLGSLAVPVFNYSTAAQNIAALRLVYQTATQIQAIFIGDFLSSLTNVQLENAFNITAGQTTTLRTNFLTPDAASAATIRTAAGS